MISCLWGDFTLTLSKVLGINGRELPPPPPPARKTKWTCPACGTMNFETWHVCNWHKFWFTPPKFNMSCQKTMVDGRCVSFSDGWFSRSILLFGCVYIGGMGLWSAHQSSLSPRHFFKASFWKELFLKGKSFTSSFPFLENFGESQIFVGICCAF